MASVPRREAQAAAIRHVQPLCACGRGPVPPMSAVCDTCAHDLAAEFWLLMGLPGIPTELPSITATPPRAASKAPRPRGRWRAG